MKLTVFLLTAAFLNVSAKVVSQQVTFSGKNVELETVFSAIEKQTGYLFIYREDVLRNAKKITITANNEPLLQFLDNIFKEQPLRYVIESKTVNVTPYPPNQKPNIPSSSGGLDNQDNDLTNSLYNVAPPIRIRIVDSAGQPLSGVTVSLRKSRVLGVTDAEGVFSANVNVGDILVFSSVGYETKSVSVTSSTSNLVITLTPSITKLEDVEVVVNTGYQKISKEKVTGSVVTITAKELEKRYTPNVLDNLEGRAPGLVNYKNSIVVRGISTFESGSRSPLYVVDGLPIEGSPANINPYDVESISVLKDAAAAAIYGVRASNGIIVITTKKARQPGTTIEFATDVTVTQKVDYSKFNFLTPAQQVDVESGYANWYFTNPTTGVSNISNFENDIESGYAVTPIMHLYYQYAQNEISKTQLDQALATFRQNDFRKEFRDNALLNQVLQQYNFAIRNKGEKFQSSLLLNYKTDNTGIIKAYDRQLNIFYKGTYSPYSWLDIDFGVNGILGKTKSSNSSFATDGTNVPSYMRLLDDNGNRVYYTTSDYNAYNTLNSSTTPQLKSMLVNHLDELERDAQLTRQNFGRYFINLKADILPGLTFSPQFQYENNVTTSRAYSEAESYTMRFLQNTFTTRTGTAPNFTYNYLVPPGGKLATSQQTEDAWTARGQLDYMKKMGNHEISLIGGTEFRESLFKGSRGLLLGYSDQLQSHNTAAVNFQAISLYRSSTFFNPGNFPSLQGNALLDQIGLIQETRQRSNSLYVNAGYTYNNRYNVFGSYRKDYADVFGLDERYRGRPLWSTGLSWNIHNEDFLSAYDWISFLKIRATYGITGNIAPGLSSLLVANSALPPNRTTQLPVSVVETAGNPQLTWEKTATTNLGLDFTLFDGRLNGAFDWYRKAGSDIFAAIRIDPSEGFLSQVINNGNMLNTGIELNLQYQWFRAEKPGGFGWSSNFVLSKNKNRVTHVDQVANTPASLTGGGLKQGYPVQSLFSYQFAGMNAIGMPQWYKANHSLTTDMLTADDLSAIVFSGGLDPVTNMTLINEVTYKGVSLNILCVYYAGHYQRVPMYGTQGSIYGAMPSYTLNAWTPDNPNSPVFPYGEHAPEFQSSSLQNTNSDVFVQPSDFVKIRYVGLAYRLPGNISSKLGSKQVQLRFQLNNPKAVWIKNKVNIDP